MGPLILIPAAAAAAIGAYMFMKPKDAAADTAAPADSPVAQTVVQAAQSEAKKKKKLFAGVGRGLKKVFTPKKTAARAEAAQVTASGLTLAGLDETKAAGTAFVEELRKMGKTVEDPTCTEDFCSVEIDAAGDPVAEAWFENEGQHIARKAAEGAGVEATLIVVGSRTFVIFSDDSRALAEEAADEGTHAAPLVEPVPTAPQAEAMDAAAPVDAAPAAEAAPAIVAPSGAAGIYLGSIGQGPSLYNKRSGLGGKVTDWGYKPRVRVFGEVPPGYGR